MPFHWLGHRPDARSGRAGPGCAAPVAASRPSRPGASGTGRRAGRSAGSRRHSAQAGRGWSGCCLGIWTSSPPPGSACRCAASSARIGLRRWRIGSGRIRFRDAGRPGPRRRRECRCSFPSACGSWRSTRCASRGGLGPRDCPSPAAPGQRASRARNPWGPSCRAPPPPERHPACPPGSAWTGCRRPDRPAHGTAHGLRPGRRSPWRSGSRSWPGSRRCAPWLAAAHPGAGRRGPSHLRCRTGHGVRRTP